MSDNRKYYYLKLKENYFDEDAIVLLESMQDGILYSNILLKLYLKSLKNGGKLQLDENIPYTAQMIATITRQQVGTVERALQIFMKLGLVEPLQNGALYMSNIELLVGHGGWGNFVKNETEFSQATASRFMKVFEAYGADQIGIFGAEAKSSTLQNLSISNALRLLAVPEEERENFAVAVDAEHISARELEKVIRERDEARASEKTAEESRAKMEQDMAMLKQLHEAAAHGEEKARAELDRVKRELAELREKPVEVAVEVKDAAPEQLAQAREEARKAAEQAWRDKLSAAEKKLSDAAAEKKALEDRVAKLQKAAKSGDGLSGEVERLKKSI